MKMKIKKKDMHHTYTFSKQDDLYVLTDGQYTFKSGDISFVRSFAERLRDSGHHIIVDASVLQAMTCSFVYGHPDARCGGCVLNTGDCCLLQKGAD